VISIANNCARPPQVAQIFGFSGKVPVRAEVAYTPVMRPLQSHSRAARLWGMAIFVLVPIAGVVSFLWLIGLWG
jgi:hypothetical protein